MGDNQKLQHPSHKRTCLCRPLKIPRTKPTDEVYNLVKGLVISDENLKKYSALVMSEVLKGLSKATNPKAAVKCFPTYIQDLPTGKEVGKYYALDLGGTNFRVILIELQKNHFEMVSRTFVLPQEKMVGLGKDLFDHVAACLHVFMLEQKLEGDSLPLGFTYSFPVVQKALDKGIITRFTKGFKCDDIIGEDVVRIFKDALQRRGILKNVVVKVVLNDTAGTLISCAWESPYCKVGLIVGTGSNAAYVEKQKNAELFDGQDHGSGLVLINCELGALGDDGSLDFVRTPEDFEIDKNSINKGMQINEKMVSGMYMGEIARLFMLKCVKAGALFGGKASSELNQRERFLTKYVSDIETDKPGVYDNCKAVLEEVGIRNPSPSDLQNVRYICECVSRRSAHMCAGLVSALIKKTGEKRVTVGIDGSVYRYHPYYHYLMMEKMQFFMPPGIVYDLMLSEDGSGRGAALTAAAAT